ncbi:MAG: hypothetical protein OXI45_00630 [Acidobacteriota bacterium]|nr:hypothetical protein [Acidobacteriota bacterium]
MNLIVPRTCTVVPAPGPHRNRSDAGTSRPDSRPLADFRSHDAYVLLADPGAGKTTAFKDEVEALGVEACPPVSAHDFLEIEDPPTVPTGKTLFIDGLDEVRAGEHNARTPFASLRLRLAKLGRPRFRLSCREADWIGENDRRDLARVSPGEQVTVLRLDPLTETDIRRVLAYRDDIPDPDDFIAMARDHGVDGLLANPQTLGMLADIVGRGGKWPDGRLATFEQSCRRIVCEHNEKHIIASVASGGGGDADLTLDAAGRLCAVHLLTGTAGFTMLPSGDDTDLLSLGQCDYHPRDVLRHALRTKLFTGQPDGRPVPVHRHVAEYLAARHLGRLVEERKLPASRVVALMTGHDGIVVAEMRGLSAWFAARCPSARARLIDCDPIGVVQYGDVSGFAHGHKRSLLGALERDLPIQGSEFGFVARLRALATPGMETAFEELLSSPWRDPERQRFVDLLLQLFGDGVAMPGLSESLLGAARDSTWRSSVRLRALDAYCHGSDNGDKLRGLKELFDGIRKGKVADPDNDLLATLLEQLYPLEMSPAELWELFCSRPPAPDSSGRYRWFWGRKLVELAPDPHVAEHLDCLGSAPSDRHGHLDYGSLGRPNLGLLARGLALHGDAIVDGREIARLYDWLGVASVRDPYLGDGRTHIKAVREWLAERPQAQKAVILEGLKRCTTDDEFDRCARDVHRRLHHSALPHDFGLWCLNQAVAMEEQPRVAQHLLERAFRALGDDRIRNGLTRRRIREATSHSDRLKDMLARLNRFPSVSEQEAEVAEQQRRYEQLHGAERARELDTLRSPKAALAGNRAPAGLLYQLARVYFGDYKAIVADESAGARAIGERYASDRSIVQAILDSFRRVPFREDLPKLTDVVRASRKNRVYHLGLPFLAGLAELERISAETGAIGPAESDASMRLAVAFHFTTIHGNYRPSWYRRLVDERPELVADVQVRIASAARKGDQATDCKLYQLAFDPAYKRVAGFSVLGLLRAYPTQCKRRFSQELEYLLIAALQHAEGEALRNLIAAKLSRSSLVVWQRVKWLAAGMLAWPDSFADDLRDHADHHESRLVELTGFLSRALSVAELANGLAHGSIAFLVRLLGSSVEPERFHRSLSGGAHDVTPAMEQSRLVRALIHRLASPRSSEAGDLLDDLVGNHALSTWRPELLRARVAQRAFRRDHGYRHPSADEVCRTLGGAEPANVADLAALVEDHLRQLGNELSHGDADGWTLFWNQDSDCLSTEPKPENACRSALLVAMRSGLPQSLEVTLEAHHARRNRSDLRVSYLGPLGQRFHVPVEAKKDEHRGLWTAIEDQLVRKYATDPAARGHGIYLVLWFGRGMTRRSPDGERPATPEALEDRLRGALSSQQARKISVCVVDVSGGVAESAAQP